MGGTNLGPIRYNTTEAINKTISVTYILTLIQDLASFNERMPEVISPL